MRRLVILLPVLLAFQVGVKPALAWTWPVDGPVLRQFTLGSDPYAGGQHRGIDIGAPSGTPVRAPASGRVSFAGTVPGGGQTLTLETAEGFSVTLVHLGTIGAARGANVGEGSTVGTVGPSGDVELAEPYVYLGIRVTGDPNGYLDPLRFLPPRVGSAPVPEPQPAPEPAPAGAADTPASAPQSPHPHPSAASQDAAEASHARAGHPPVPLHLPVDRPAITVTGSRQAGSDGPPAVAGELLTPRARRSLLSFEPTGAVVLARAPSRARGEAHPSLWWLGAAALAVAAGAAVAFLRVRGQLGDAGAADRTATVLMKGALPPAEDAAALRLGEEDRLILDGDLERILLAQPEPFPDLNRNHDSAELIDVADDSRPCHSPPGAGSRCNRLSGSHRLRVCPFIRAIGLRVPS